MASTRHALAPSLPKFLGGKAIQSCSRSSAHTIPSIVRSRGSGRGPRRGLLPMNPGPELRCPGRFGRPWVLCVPKAPSAHTRALYPQHLTLAHRHTQAESAPSVLKTHGLFPHLCSIGAKT